MRGDHRWIGLNTSVVVRVAGVAVRIRTAHLLLLRLSSVCLAIGGGRLVRRILRALVGEGGIAHHARWLHSGDVHNGVSAAAAPPHAATDAGDDADIAEHDERDGEARQLVTAGVEATARPSHPGSVAVTSRVGAAVDSIVALTKRGATAIGGVRPRDVGHERKEHRQQRDCEHGKACFVQHLALFERLLDWQRGDEGTESVSVTVMCCNPAIHFCSSEAQGGFQSIVRFCVRVLDLNRIALYRLRKMTDQDHLDEYHISMI